MCVFQRSPAFRRAFLLLALAVLSSLPLWRVCAQEQAAQFLALPPIVVGATRLPTPEDQLGTSVTVIDSAEIERKQLRTLPDLLQDVPGLNVVQTGGPGGLTAVYMRGTNPNHTKVFIDGIDVGDPSSADASFDFSQILTSQIERVEVLRGPQSGLYGSDAIGGVINIITKTGSGPPQFRASIEGGSFGTFNQSAGASGSVARFNYNFDISHFHSDDTDVTPSALAVPGRPVNSDRYDNMTYATKLGAGLTDNFDVGLVARYVATGLRSTFDDFLGPEAVPSISDNRELFTRASGHLVLFDGVFDQTFGVAYTDYTRNFLDVTVPPAEPNIFRGNRIKFDWQGNIQIVPGEVFTLGAEHQIDQIDDNAPVQARVTNDAGFLQLQSSIGDRFFNAVSLRYDNNGAFGGEPTFRVAPAFLLPETGTKLKGSVGTGFKAPSLDELFENFPAFGFFANPNLRPETSLGYDLGFEQALLDQRVQFGATWFHNDIKNLITFNDAFTTYANVGRAHTFGWESFIAYKPWEVLTLRADYTFTIANDDVAMHELLRRPKDKASLNATWQATERASFSATLVYTGPWIDVNRSGTETGITANSYTLLNLAGSYDIGHGVTAFARINNFLDRHYQDPLGFQHQGLGIFVGIKVALDMVEKKP